MSSTTTHIGLNSTGMLAPQPQHCELPSAANEEYDIEQQCAVHPPTMKLPSQPSIIIIQTFHHLSNAVVTWVPLLSVYLWFLLSRGGSFDEEDSKKKKGQPMDDDTLPSRTHSASSTSSLEAPVGNTRLKRRVAFQLPDDDQRPSSRGEERRARRSSPSKRFQRAARRDTKPRPPRRQISNK